jgi:hypothetical protein
MGTAEREYIIGTGFAAAGGRYHLFYDTQDPDSPREGGGYQLAYAYSNDGIRWFRPVLGAGETDPPDNCLNLGRGEAGAWNHVMMCSGGALWAEDGLRLWVAGYHEDDQGALHAELGYCRGPDPAQLVFAGAQPALTNGCPGSFDDAFVRVPCIIREPDRLRMYYSAGDSSGGWSVGYAESEDGMRWTRPSLGLWEYGGSRANNLVLSAEAERGELRVCHPWVICNSTGYRMYYSVSVDSGAYAIGTATSPDGINWRKDQRVVVLPRGSEGEFDYWYAAIPKVVRDDSGYRMWYTGYNGGPANAGLPAAYALGHAVSDDGVNWRKSSHNPVLAGRERGPLRRALPGATAPGRRPAAAHFPSAVAAASTGTAGRGGGGNGGRAGSGRMPRSHPAGYQHPAVAGERGRLWAHCAALGQYPGELLFLCIAAGVSS